MKKLAFLSQKGGVCKTSLVALTSVAFSGHGWSVLSADMDVSQKSLVALANFRDAEGIEPVINARSFNDVSDVLKEENYDLIIFDGAPHATLQTVEIGKVSDLIVLPTSTSIMDLSVQVKLAHDLHPYNKNIVFLLSKVSKNELEIMDAREYVNSAGYNVLDHVIFDRTAYRRAFIHGRVHTEVTYKTLVEDAENVVQEIANQLTK